MEIARLAHWPQFRQAAEDGQVVGDGTYLSTGEAAKVMGISQSTVINMANRGELPSTKVGKHRRILRTVAEAYRDKMAAEAAGE